MSVFKFLDYKKYLKEAIRQHKEVYGYKTKLSNAAGCRNSYFSQVLNSDFHLAAEHALGLANFWGFSAMEKDYFIQLIHLARAGTPELRKYYESICRQLAADHERAVVRGSAKEVSEDWKALFYSSWHYTAIHDLTTFPGGQTAEAIARRLEIPKELAEEGLSSLKAMGLVEKRDQGWQASVQEVVVPVGTHHAALHVGHWTQRAAMDAVRRKRPLESFHKCWVFGVSPDDYRKLRELIIDHIQKAQKIVPASERRELACMNLHLFVV
jgi:uncharacterized protein (TIGR02147 family)